MSHTWLLKILEYIGVRGAAYNLLESCLHPPKEFVEIENKLSSEELVLFGVPLLFSIYLIPTLNTNRSIISSVDDTVIKYKMMNIGMI